MTKVKVDVQVVATGGVGDGKSLVLDRILKAIKRDEGLQSICKIHPARCFDTLRSEQAGLSFEGELLQTPGPKAPKETHSNIPGYPDTDAMLDYLVSKVQHVELMKELLNHEYDKPISQPLVVRVDGFSGRLYEYRADHAMGPGCRLITLNLATADAPTDPVGMDQVDPQTAIVGEPGPVMARGGYVDRCAMIKPDESSIKLTKAEIQSGVDRVRWAEGLIRQLPETHEGRNSWLSNYGKMSKADAKIFIENIERCKAKPETAASVPDAHSKANDALLMLNPSVAQQFQPLNREEEGDGVYPGGLVAGNKVQVIFDNGDIAIGPADLFKWRKGRGNLDIVYWRRM